MRFLIIFGIVSITHSSSLPGTSRSFGEAEKNAYAARDDIVRSVLAQHPDWSSAQIFYAVQPMIHATGLRDLSYHNLRNQLTGLRRELKISRKRDTFSPDELAFLKTIAARTPSVRSRDAHREFEAKFGAGVASQERVANWLYVARRPARYVRTKEGEVVRVPRMKAQPLTEEQEEFLQIHLMDHGVDVKFVDVYVNFVAKFGSGAARKESVKTSWRVLIRARAESKQRSSSSRSASMSPSATTSKTGPGNTPPMLRTGSRSSSSGSSIEWIPGPNVPDFASNLVVHAGPTGSRWQAAHGDVRDSIIETVLLQHPSWSNQQIHSAADPLILEAGLEALTKGQAFYAIVNQIRTNISKQRETLPEKQNALLNEEFLWDPTQSADAVIEKVRSQFPDVDSSRVHSWWKLAQADARKSATQSTIVMSSRSSSPAAVSIPKTKIHRVMASAWTPRHSEITKEEDDRFAEENLSLAHIHRICSARFAAEGLTGIKRGVFNTKLRDIRMIAKRS